MRKDKISISPDFLETLLSSSRYSLNEQLLTTTVQQQQYSQISGQQSYTDFPLISDSYDTPGDLFDMNQDLSVSHTRPHPSSQNRNSDQIESSLQSFSDQSRTTRDSDQIESSRRNLSVHSMSQHANETLLTSTSDWSMLESSLIGDLSATQTSTGPASLQQSRVSSGMSPLSSRSRNTNANANVSNSRANVAANAAMAGSTTIAANASNTAIAANAPGLFSITQYQSTANINNASGGVVSGSGSMISVDPSDPHDVPLQSQRPALHRSTVLRELNESCLQVSESLQTIRSSRSEYTGLNTDLQRLRSVLQISQTRQETIVSEGVLEEIQAFQSQLSDLSSRLGSSSSSGTGAMSNPLLLTLDPEYAPEFFRQCQISARRLVRSLCATINTVQAHNTGTHVAVTQTATTGLSFREAPRASSLPGTSMWAYGEKDALASTEAGLFSYSNAILQVCQTQRSMVLAGVVLAVLAFAVLGLFLDASMVCLPISSFLFRTSLT